MIRAILVMLSLSITQAASEPVASLPFQRQLIREVHFRWGLDGPVAAMAAQIQQESGWRPGICSPYACGLTQFTPSTAAWISGLEPELAGGNRFNPSWAIRALVLYDFILYNKVPLAADECARWAFTLSAYNGGLGWVQRDVALCWRTPACDPTQWWGNVALQSKRAGWALKENRGYPFKILRNQSTYSTWGRQVECPRLPQSPLGSISSPVS